MDWARRDDASDVSGELHGGALPEWAALMKLGLQTMDPREENTRRERR